MTAFLLWLLGTTLSSCTPVREAFSFCQREVGCKHFRVLKKLIVNAFRFVSGSFSLSMSLRCTTVVLLVLLIGFLALETVPDHSAPAQPHSILLHFFPGNVTSNGTYRYENTTASPIANNTTVRPVGNATLRTSL
jgi:hypothetical protein